MIQIYTDGSCSGNPGPGGSAFLVVKQGEIVYNRLFSFKSTTNNFCELFAVLEAIRYAIDNNIIECKILSDSKYVVNGINEWMLKWIDNNWKGSSGHEIKNVDIWKNVSLLWGISKSLTNISIHYVKGHSTDEFNKIVDKMAKEATKKN